MNNKRKIFLLLSLVVVVGVSVFAVHRFRNLDAADAPLFDELGPAVRVEHSDIAETVSALGTLNSSDRVEISTEVEGTVKEILVEKGERVEEGEPLIILDVSEWNVRLKQAEADVLSLRSELDSLLEGPDEAEIAQAESTLEDARIALERAEEEYESNMLLAMRNGIASRTLRESEREVRSLEKRLEVAEKNWEKLVKGAEPEDIAVAEARLAKAEADLETARDKVEAAVVRSPIDGTVIEIEVKTGDLVDPASSLGRNMVVIADLDIMKASVPINEIDIPRVHEGIPAFITPDALPDHHFEGEVSSVAYEGVVIDNIVTYEVNALVPNPDGMLRSGMTVDVEVVLESRSDVLVLPLDAVQETPQGYTVTVRGEGGRPQTRQVRVGLRSETYIEITEGLAEGDEVLGIAVVPQNTASSRSGTPPFWGGSR